MLNIDQLKYHNEQSITNWFISENWYEGVYIMNIKNIVEKWRDFGFINFKNTHVEIQLCLSLEIANNFFNKRFYIKDKTNNNHFSFRNLCLLAIKDCFTDHNLRLTSFHEHTFFVKTLIFNLNENYKNLSIKHNDKIFNIFNDFCSDIRYVRH